MNFPVLTVAEKFRNALKNSDYDGIIVVGSDHVRYLSGASLPFLDNNFNRLDRMVIILWPKNGDPIIICPTEWESTIRNLSWISRIVSYSSTEARKCEAAGQSLSNIEESIIRLGEKKKIGMDMNRAPYPFFEHLQRLFPDITFVGCEEWLRGLRAVKTQKEIELLEEVAYRTDHGILGAAHHILTTALRPEKGLAEIIRVHCLERNLDAVGYHSVSQGASGKNGEKFWPLAPKFGVGGGKNLVPGEMVRLEMRASLNGYWSDAARMLIMGVPSAEQVRAYHNMVTLRDTAIKNLRPGTTCSSVFEAVREVAKQKGIDLLCGLGLGHGIGVTAYEAPYMNAEDHTEIKEGMVLVLDPVIYGTNREIMRSKDTVVITEKGCKIIGWYKDWREPYIALNSYQHGGG